MSFHWSKQEELGSGVWQFRLLLAIFSILGSTLMGIIVKPITFVFFIIAGKRRQYSRDYLRTIADFSGQKAARNCSVHRHFQSFAVSMVDKMSAWAGRLNLGNIEFAPGGGYENLVDSLKHGRGVLAICSHLGNIEMLRALGTLSVNNISNFHIIAIVYFNGTARFHEMIRSINGDSIAGILSVSDIGPQTIIMLKEFADNGGMIVIAGDRTAPNNSGRTINQEFLGRPAKFPYGSFFLADLLKVPVYTIFSMRADDTSLNSYYRFHVWKSTVSLDGSRRERKGRIKNLAVEFRNHLQEIVLEYPCQWFNFYPFWGISSLRGKG